MKWAKQTPDKWPRIVAAYENGYNGKKGGEAVWELMVSDEFTGGGFVGWLARFTGDVQSNPLSWWRYKIYDKTGL